MAARPFLDVLLILAIHFAGHNMVLFAGTPECEWARGIVCADITSAGEVEPFVNAATYYIATKQPDKVSRVLMWMAEYDVLEAILFSDDDDNQLFDALFAGLLQEGPDRAATEQVPTVDKGAASVIKWVLANRHDSYNALLRAAARCKVSSWLCMAMAVSIAQDPGYPLQRLALMVIDAEELSSDAAHFGLLVQQQLLGIDPDNGANWLLAAIWQIRSGDNDSFVQSIDLALRRDRWSYYNMPVPVVHRGSCGVVPSSLFACHLDIVGNSVDSCLLELFRDRGGLLSKMLTETHRLFNSLGQHNLNSGVVPDLNERLFAVGLRLVSSRCAPIEQVVQGGMFIGQYSSALRVTKRRDGSSLSSITVSASQFLETMRNSQRFRDLTSGECARAGCRNSCVEVALQDEWLKKSGLTRECVSRFISDIAD